MSLDLERIRKAFLDETRIGTHYLECEYNHWRCAMWAMIREIRDLRAGIILNEQDKKKAIHKVKGSRSKLPKSRRVPLVQGEPKAQRPKAKGKRR